MDIPATCITISEFHDVKDLIFVIKAKDADDPTTPNGRVKIRILSGNELGLYKWFCTIDALLPCRAPSDKLRIYRSHKLIT